MKAYCCQFDIEWEKKEANFIMVENLLRVTGPEPRSLVILPEMFATGFSMNVDSIAEEQGGPAEQFLARLAKECGIFLAGGVATRAADGEARNEAVVFGPDGGLLARYAKIHPFSLGGELDHYGRGTDLALFDWNGLKVAPFICYDLRFPEIFRAAVQQGAEMFLLIANWPSKREGHWVTLLQARAIENLAYVAGVNRAGADPLHTYPGRTLIIDPHGAIAADAGEGEGVVSADINPAAVRSWRSDFPALADMHWSAAHSKPSPTL